MGLLATSVPRGARDQDLVGRGPLAKELRQSFYEIYSVWEHYERVHYLETNLELFKDNPYYFEVPEKPFVTRFETYLKDKRWKNILNFLFV